MMRIGVTMGDANGVGPEILLKAWTDGWLGSETVVIGDSGVLERCARTVGLVFPPVRSAGTLAGGGEPCLRESGLLAGGDVNPGRVDRKVGEAARSYVQTATALALQGGIDAMVTLPINKEAVRLSDPAFTGHTELIAGLCGVVRCTMMLVSGRLRVSHVSTHVSMREALDAVRRERILEVIRLTHEAAAAEAVHPRIAVAGLNPHAGEGGAFGGEEALEIQPAVAAAVAEGLDVAGPFPADTVFLRALNGEFDAVVSMYHDQGHIALKMADFHGGVNVTLGLPIVRTSVDHGTAYDIAYMGRASTRSFREAYAMARALAARRLRAH
jgi:4-phospho-D-threonate 3-dehydrogenase / 4-phospho-D-erythronate 3-dehydrogenase